MEKNNRKVPIQSIPLFVNALPVVQKLQSAGYEAVFVGGSVRDLILSKEISDVDIATSATPFEVKEIFSHTVDVGIEHGTVLVLYAGEGYEVTTFRTESTYQDFRHPDSVTFVRSLEEDLKRRDFTMNALAINNQEEIVDYFNGLEDIDSKTIRCVGNPLERFNEDALRMMRAVRFAGQLGFTIEESTFEAICTLKSNLEKVAVERMRVEFDKMIQSDYRDLSMESFVKSGLYQSCPQFKEFSQALLNIGQFPLKHLSVTQAWVLLAFYEQIDPTKLVKLLKEWKSSNEQVDAVSMGYRALLTRVRQPWDSFMTFNCEETIAYEVEALLPGLGFQADMPLLESTYQQLPIRSRKEIEIDGFGVKKALGLEKMGPEIGKTLQDVQTAILSGTLKNEHSAIVRWIQEKRR